MNLRTETKTVTEQIPELVETQERLEELLLKGLNSGTATPMTKQDWEDIRSEIRSKRSSALGKYAFIEGGSEEFAKEKQI